MASKTLTWPLITRDRLGLVRAFCAALVLAGCASKAPNPQAGIEQLDALANDLARRGFAGQLAVMHEGRVLLNQGYGRMSPDDDRPVTSASVMPLASLTKPITASAVIALSTAGKLRLDDPIGNHLSGLAPAWASIEIHYFLTHQAGLPAEIINRAWDGEPRFEPISRNTLLQRLGQFEPNYPPGAAFNYSNVGYTLLAALIETISDQPWEEALRDLLLEPAGVSNIGFSKPGWQSDQLLAGRRGRHRLGHYFDQPTVNDGIGWHLRGAGDLLASSDGIISWWHALGNQRWLTKAGMDLWLAPRVTEPDGSRYGYGLHFRASNHGPVVGHTGGDQVFSVDFSWYTDMELKIYIASADPRFEADVIREQLHRRLLPRLTGQ